MKTYLVYNNQNEVYRGTIPDCCNFITDKYTYTDDDAKIHIVIMCPHLVNFEKLNDDYKKYMISNLTYDKRKKFNNKLIIITNSKKLISKALEIPNVWISEHEDYDKILKYSDSYDVLS